MNAEINVIANSATMKPATTQVFPSRFRRGIRKPPPKPKMKILSG
jgi:hypothetical protein